MKKLIAAALLVVLSGAPSIVLAAVPPAPPAAVGETPGRRLAAPVAVDEQRSEARDYAAREAAAPELGAFEGGDGGIYIGGGALTVVLIVLLIVILI